MSSVDKSAVLNYLVDSMRTLHAEDQELQRVLRRVQTSRAVGPEEFEALCDAQRMALRIPANALLMLVGLLDDAPDANRAQLPPPTCAGRGFGLRARLRKFMRGLDGL